MTTYETTRAILAELDRVLSQVNEEEAQALLNAILKAQHIIIHGLGREGLAMRSFAMRLAHLGFQVAVLGDMATPPAGPGDLFLVSCGPGYLSTVEPLMTIAQKAGAQVAMLTAQPEALLPQRADLRVYLPAQTMAQVEGSSSGQAMGSAFEQAMWIFFDALVPRLMAATGQGLDDLRRRHTNLE